jgi:hypothetical protein
VFAQSTGALAVRLLAAFVSLALVLGLMTAPAVATATSSTSTDVVGVGLVLAVSGALLLFLGGSERLSLAGDRLAFVGELPTKITDLLLRFRALLQFALGCRQHRAPRCVAASASRLILLPLCGRCGVARCFARLRNITLQPGALLLQTGSLGSDRVTAGHPSPSVAGVADGRDAGSGQPGPLGDAAMGARDAAVNRP